MIAELGGYPDLPYDQKSEQIKFKIIQSTEQLKKVNYNRILEWSAIKFGSIKNVLHYNDFESGKIVIKGWFDVTHRDEYKNFWGKSKEGINTTKCYMTFIFTIIDGSVKIEVLNVKYQFKSYSQLTSAVYNPGVTLEMSIHDIYPITNFDSDEWKGKLDLLNQTNIKIEKLMISLKAYIKDYDEDYKF